MNVIPQRHNGTQNGGRTLRRRFVAEPHCIAAARRATEELDGLVGPQTRADVSLLVSELVTNAVLHGSQRPTDSISLSLEACDTGVRVMVSDSGQGFAADSPATTKRRDRPGGLGLVLVDKMAERWGVMGDGPTRVWFELADC